MNLENNFKNMSESEALEITGGGAKEALQAFAGTIFVGTAPITGLLSGGVLGVSQAAAGFYLLEEATN